MAVLNTLAMDHEFKKPEIILCFPQSLFPKGVFRKDELPTLETLRNNQIWVTRDFANANTDILRQAASYAIIYKIVDGKVKVATYSRAGGDAKLQSKLSVGYGGHPELIDLIAGNSDKLPEITDQDLSATLFYSTTREIDEEVQLVYHDGIPQEAIVRNDRHYFRDPIVETEALYYIQYETFTKARYGHEEVPVITPTGIAVKATRDLVVGDQVRRYRDDPSVYDDYEIKGITKNDIGSYHIGFMTFIEVHPETEAVSTDPENDKFMGFIDAEELLTSGYKSRLEIWSNYALVFLDNHIEKQTAEGKSLAAISTAPKESESK